jgi:hypothetical protein
MSLVTMLQAFCHWSNRNASFEPGIFSKIVIITNLMPAPSRSRAMWQCLRQMERA